MQGTAADIIKRAMIAADQWLYRDNPDAKMIMQVHDELVFEIAEDHVNDCVANIRTLMCTAADLDVPLLVDIGIGNNWMKLINCELLFFGIMPVCIIVTA